MYKTLMTTLFALLPICVAAQPTVQLTDGALNGQAVVSGVLEVIVEPGEPIVGTVSIDANNNGGPANIAPLVMVWNWGTHETSFSTIDSWIPDGVSSHDVPIDMTAPAAEGTYYYTFAFALEKTGAQVASLTNWQVDAGNPHWDDGYDIADWGATEYDQSVIEYQVTTQYEGPAGWHEREVAAAMVKVTVVDLSTVDLASGGLNGFDVANGKLEITVEPGEPIAGTVSVDTDNLGGPSNIAPLVLVWNWDAHETSFSTIDSWIPDGASSHDVVIDMTAPAVEGTYYYTIAFALEKTGAQVASLTNWQVDAGNPHWNDGYDIADWSNTEYDESLLGLGVTCTYEGPSGFHERKVSAAMVKVTVVDLSTVDLVGGGLNGIDVANGKLEIMVEPGEQIAGTVSIDADNLGGPSNIAPLVMVWNWDAHETSFSTIDSWIPDGASSHDVIIDMMAPAAEGVYYFTFAFALEKTGAQVASLTNWQVDAGNPHWNDGCDIADWGEVEYNESLLGLGVTCTYEGPSGFHERNVSAAMVSVTVQEGSAADGVDIQTGLPDDFELSQNYPNPFNPATVIRYTLPKTARVQVTIYNLLGQEMEKLVNEKQNAGYYQVAWNGKNMASGVYFYHISAGSFVKTKKMLLLK
jgi:hypothetical protein